MTDRHCRIGRVAIRRPIYIPGYTFIERLEPVEDYDEPPQEYRSPPTWWIYRHNNPEVGRYT